MSLAHSLPLRLTKRNSKRESDNRRTRKSKEPEPDALSESKSRRSSDSNVVQGQTPSVTARSRTRQIGRISRSRDNNPPILQLPEELLLLIVEHVEGPWEALVPIDKRAYLSVESFGLPPSKPEDAVEALSNIRQVCKLFSKIGAARQFARVACRFSQDGFRRLELIAGQEHLAKAVKKFTYKVPYFVTKVEDEPPGSPYSPDIVRIKRTMRDQAAIIDSGEDLRVLKIALAAFTELQHVQIMPTEDELQAQLIKDLRQNPHMDLQISLEWGPACSHSTRTLGEALIASKSSCSRFSSPRISPESILILADDVPGSAFDRRNTLGGLAERLSCLELHFHEDIDMNAKMRDLSPFFLGIFRAAKNMQAVHIGFPTHKPIDIPLEDIFHNIRWDKLVAFGIQSWKLQAEEVTTLASRHKDRLRGLRLRDVLLKEGSIWMDVLMRVRRELRQLDWVSLKGIGYSDTFDQRQQQPQFGEMFDDPPDLYSSEEYSDSEAELSSEEPSSSDSDPDASSDSDSDSDEDRQEEDDDDMTDDEHSTSRHDTSFPSFSSSDNGPRAETRRQHSVSIDEDASYEEFVGFNDNGVEVPNANRRRMEQWVARRSRRD